jgi:hypothetical protein
MESEQRAVFPRLILAASSAAVFLLVARGATYFRGMEDVVADVV